MKRCKSLALIGSICLALVLVALPSMVAHAKSPAEPSGELRIGTPNLYTETFHPFWATCHRKFYTMPFYDPLIGTDEKGNLDPDQGLAYHWKEAPDHMSWTFWIRDGVKFHDGTPVTLEDVKFSLDTMIDPKNMICKSLHARQDRVELVPPNKVVVHLKSPWPMMAYYLTPSSEGGGTIVPKKYLESVSDEYYESHPIGSGPYKFLEKKEGNHIKLMVAGDYHWRVGTPKYKNLTFKLLPEEGTREAALRAGEVDLIQVGVTRADKLESEGFEIHEKNGAVNMFLHFGRTYQPDNPLHKKGVRQALIYAIDKASILKHVLMGRGELIGHVFQMFSWSISYKEYPVTPYDPKKAKQLLAEAGYPNGFTIYLYSYVTFLPEQKLVNEAIASYWEAIGMKVKIIDIDFGAFWAIWMKKKEPLGPAAWLHSWATRPMDSWRSLYSSDVKKHFVSQYKDRVMDKLIEKYEAAMSLDEFIKADRACEERALEMFYASGIVSTHIFFASRPNEIPKWNMGRGNGEYRVEYIGAIK